MREDVNESIDKEYKKEFQCSFEKIEEEELIIKKKNQQ